MGRSRPRLKKSLHLLTCPEHNLLKSQSITFTRFALTLLPTGENVHKVFGWPVPLLSDSSSNISLQSKEGKFLRETDVFILHESAMAPCYALVIMDRTFKDIINNNLLFGGKIVIIGGHFCQLLPVLPRANRSQLFNISIKNSLL